MAEKTIPPPKSSTKPRKKLHRLRAIWPSPTIRVYLYGGLATLILSLGSALLNGHPKPFLVAWALIFIGCCFFAQCVRLWLVNHKAKHPMRDWVPNFWHDLIIMLAISGCLYAILQEKPVGYKSTLTKDFEWQPPELPKGCDIVEVCFGGGGNMTSGKRMRRDWRQI